MLFDLTKVSDQRVSQVDELKLGSRHWVRTSDLGIFAAGLLAGGVVVLPLRMIFGGVWMFLFCPVAGVIALVLFSRKRSTAGEVNQRRFDRMLNARKSMNGMFVIPGDGGEFDPNGFTVLEVHDHPVYPMDDDLI